MQFRCGLHMASHTFLALIKAMVAVIVTSLRRFLVQNSLFPSDSNLFIYNVICLFLLQVAISTIKVFLRMDQKGMY